MILTSLLLSIVFLDVVAMRGLSDLRRPAGSLTTAFATPRISGIITPKKIDDITTQIKVDFNAAVGTIVEQTAVNVKSWNSTFAALSRALGESAEASAIVTLPSMTHGEAAARAASTRAKDELKTLFDETFARRDLHDVLAATNVSDGTSQKRSASDEYFRNKIMELFQRNGCALQNTEDRKELLMKRKLIEETCSTFISTVNENTDSLTFSEEEMNGIDLNQFPLQTYNAGQRRISLKAPDTMPILQFAKNPETRKTVAVAMAKKCQSENTRRFLDTLRWRHECAALLGYPSHSHFMLKTKMASNPERAEKFLLNLLPETRQRCLQDLKELLKLKKAEQGPNAGPIEPWDTAYYIRMYKASLGVDEAELRNYFPLDHVKREIFSIYEELLNVTFSIMEDAEVWHPDVECYEVRQVDNGSNSKQALGYFYLDLFPRDGKYSHQCVYPLRPSYSKSSEKEPRVRPACVNIGNLSRGADGKPSMLRFREVETFFHEFGHVMHCVLAKSEHSLQSWAWSAVPWFGGVEQDFLEVPSMMLENFVWQPEVLRRLSKRFDDGKPLSEPVIEALSKSRFLMKGYTDARYLAMALYDLKVHSGCGPYMYNGTEYDAVQLYNAMLFDISGVPGIPDTFAVASWYHLMMGYDAGYYSYVWSEAFAADLFSKFEGVNSKSVINSELGKLYRDTILSPCATLDGNSMLKNFLGREPTIDAYLRRRTV